MKLALDVMGGDQGPAELLHGIRLGLAADASTPMMAQYVVIHLHIP